MAFALDVIVGSLTYVQSLSDGNPFSLVSANGLSMAPLHRLTEHAPRQDGDTDQGYRLDPRTITLTLNINAATAAALDTARDLLSTIFTPHPGYSILLRVTRDDGEVRQIECQTTGPVDVPLVKEHHPGHLHRVVVQLRAANPVWYDPALYSLSYDQSSWWLAGGTIGTASVLEHVTYPTARQAWAWAGTVANFTVAFRTKNPIYVSRYAWFSTLASGEIQYVRTSTAAEFSADGGVMYLKGRRGTVDYVNLMGMAAMPVSDANYFYRRSGTVAAFYFGTTQMASWMGTIDLRGSVGAWRGLSDAGQDWPFDLPMAAIYGTALNTAELTALDDAMSDANIIGGSATLTYVGNFPEYPTITLQGPLGSPKIVNITLGGTLDFTGSTINAGEAWTVDLKQRTIYDNAGARIDSPTGDAGLTGWYLGPTTGGTNIIQATAGTAGTASNITLYYNNRYVSF